MQSFIIKFVAVLLLTIQQATGQSGFYGSMEEAYAAIPVAAVSYTVAVGECVNRIKTLKGCNAGSNGIPSAFTPAANSEAGLTIASLTVLDGVITVTPATYYGITSEDTYILTPTISTGGNITWVASGGGVTKGYAKKLPSLPHHKE